MQFTTFVLAALASTTPFASAAPAPHSQRRTATTTTVGLPNRSFSISADPASGAAVKSVQAFPVALPAHECTLFWQFQPGFPVAQSRSPSGQRPQINVFDVNGNAPGALVGTFTIGKQDGLPHTINTFQCRDPLTVRFEIATDSGRPGSVRFEAEDYARKNGIFVKYTHEGK